MAVNADEAAALKGAAAFLVKRLLRGTQCRDIGGGVERRTDIMIRSNKLRTAQETERQIEQEKRDAAAAAKEWWDREDFQPQPEPELPADPWESR